MFQLLEFLAEHLGSAILGGLQATVYAIIEASDCDECGFNDLGKLLFGGLILAIVVGFAISILRQRVNRSQNDFACFVSIRSPQDEK